MCCVEHVGVAAFRRVRLVVLRALAHMYMMQNACPADFVMWLCGDNDGPAGPKMSASIETEAWVRCLLASAKSWLLACIGKILAKACCRMVQSTQLTRSQHTTNPYNLTPDIPRPQNPDSV